jgi:hypothetical protein
MPFKPVRPAPTQTGPTGGRVVPVSGATGSSTGHAGGTPAWNAVASAHRRRQASPLVSHFLTLTRWSSDGMNLSGLQASSSPRTSLPASEELDSAVQRHEASSELAASR